MYTPVVLEATMSEKIGLYACPITSYIKERAREIRLDRKLSYRRQLNQRICSMQDRLLEDKIPPQYIEEYKEAIQYLKEALN